MREEETLPKERSTEDGQGGGLSKRLLWFDRLTNRL
jgi:hypothetical protein